MSRRSSFARRCMLMPALSALCVAACLLPARAQSNNGDPENPNITAHINNMSFAAALNILCRSAGMQFQLPADIAAQIDPNAKCTLDITNGTFQDALNGLLGQVNPPLAFHLENGTYVLEASKTPRPVKTVKKMRRGARMAKNRAFEKAIDELFAAEGVRYRIEPSVTAFLDPVSFSVQDATFDEELALLLSAVEGQKTPLVYRKEKDTYIIAPKDRTKLPDVNTTPLGLPSYHPEPLIQSVAITNEHPGAALMQMFRQAGVNYHVLQPSSVADTPRISLAMRGVPLEQAVVHLLRAAPATPALHLLIPDGMEGKRETKSPAAADPPLIYNVGPMRATFPMENGDGNAPAYRHWFGFHDCDLYAALKTLMASKRQNYSIDGAMRSVKITASGSNLSLEEAVAQLLKASPAPIKLNVRDGIFEFSMPDDATPAKRP